MSRPLTILLPPSEGKASGGSLPGWDPASGVFGADLARQRQRVAKALARVRGGNQKMLGVRGTTLEQARTVNRELLGAPVLPAGERFTGVVWGHLDLGTLTPAARRRAGTSIVVVSALAGLVAADDPLPDHRLKLSVSLGTLGRISSFWREPLSAVLNDHLDGHLVIDLLPAEHAAAWLPDPDRYDLRRIRLVDATGRTAGHDAKAAKGAFARALLTSRSPERELEQWTHPGFSVVVAR